MPRLQLLKHYVVNILGNECISRHLHSVCSILLPRLDIDDELLEVQIHWTIALGECFSNHCLNAR